MDQAIIKVSSKRQITIPAAIYKKLGIQPGQKLFLEVHGDKLIIWPKTKSYTELLAGSLKGVYGQTKEEIDVYVRKERETWEKTPS
ncbi:AbrB/MazE/SpoVT family DNA-binding domain-containing protein [Neomoorella thermoacetica]|uniref:SpoVT / AbrB like domain protein n=3 Tax=Neomoorella thermoacetica TaxID=1525 RepID=A0A1D7X769_NEOTH|nr:AbrB/MazE/SpoVT family DNA-binding domain-containing protein [Moorella thermoacetica]AKX93085.1 SpoVT / AbrB like domain protein [Moorella thermoacetica]AKX95635.1 SpoVT / AbrB like domain protein [Moorella thermoacetica]AOQ22756.1 SpoVT / AbrB like domain protein [Moorella thermoacetica]APC07434.1 SpoVT / AbrB like domain protein [Moorella thermoacetica]OIQ08782.1 SpoVT / AbrB like domain protein [Moorella thermoacetica]